MGPILGESFVPRGGGSPFGSYVPVVVEEGVLAGTPPPPPLSLASYNLVGGSPPGLGATYTAGLAYGGPGPVSRPLSPLPERFAGFGTWNELIAGGVVDRSYIEQEAERRKQEVDRAMDNQLARLESQCLEQCATIQQQAEYHTQMAERQIENSKRQHLAHISRQAELQTYAITQRAEVEKGRLGAEACRALTQQAEREKAAVLHESMRRAEDVWRQSQRALLEQAQRSKMDIDVQAQRRAADIEREARQAVSRVYISPSSTLPPVGAFGGPPAVGTLEPPRPGGSFVAPVPVIPV